MSSNHLVELVEMVNKTKAPNHNTLIVKKDFIEKTLLLDVTLSPELEIQLKAKPEDQKLFKIGQTKFVIGHLCKLNMVITDDLHSFGSPNWMLGY